MYQRVVLAYDGTVEGRAALREGALVAKTHGAQVFLLSVIPEMTGMRLAEGVHPGAIAQHQTSYQAILAEGLARLKQLGFHPIAHQVAGDPASRIGAYARQISADLVVIGHRRQTMLGRWWSGSTGGLLVDNIDCSILISRKVISDEEFHAALARLAAPA